MLWKERAMKELEFTIDVSTNLFIRILQSAQNKSHQFGSNSLDEGRGVLKMILAVKSKLRRGLSLIVLFVQTVWRFDLTLLVVSMKPRSVISANDSSNDCSECCTINVFFSLSKALLSVGVLRYVCPVYMCAKVCRLPAAKFEARTDQNFCNLKLMWKTEDPSF